MDLRDDRETLTMLSEQNLSPIKREQGQKLANKIRAVKYMECSALTQRGLKQVSLRQFLNYLALGRIRQIFPEIRDKMRTTTV